MDGGLFQQWQPIYAEAGVATFPVRDKKPAVKHWLKAGMKASAEFGRKGSFANDDAFGFACRRSKITVFDYDAPDERGFRDCLDEIGPTPLIVRTASGNFHAYFANNGERRLVRPDKTRPFDILGDGFAVAPPSRTAKGASEIICGSLQDLANLPTMKLPTIEAAEDVEGAPPLAPQPTLAKGSREGDGRNDRLFKRMVAAGHTANSLENLMQTAAEVNAQFAEPLSGEEVSRVAGSVWRYKQEGRLFRTGGEANAVLTQSEADHLWDQPTAMALLMRLRMAHSHRNGGEFAIALAMAETMGVSPKTFRAARETLVQRYFLEMTHPGGRGKNDPPRARLL